MIRIQFESMLEGPYRDPYKSSQDPYGYNKRLPDLRPFLAACLLSRFMTQPRSIVDVGCGEGYITKAVAKAFPQARVYGLDRSLIALERARLVAGREAHNIEFVQWDVVDRPFLLESVDILLLMDCLEYIGQEEYIYEQLLPGAIVLYDYFQPYESPLRTIGEVDRAVPSYMKEKAAVTIQGGLNLRLLVKGYIKE